MAWMAARMRTSSSRLMLGFVGLQLVSTAYLAVLPSFGVSVVAAASQALPGLLTAAAVTVGVRKYRPEHPAPWILIAASMVFYSAGTTTFYVHHEILGDPSFPTPADLFYLADYACAVASVVLFVRRRTPDWDLIASVDAGILVVGATLLQWVFLISPAAYDDAEVSALARAVSGAYPLLDILLLAMVLRLMLGAGVRTRSFWLLTVAVLVYLAADAGYGVQSLMGIVRPIMPLEMAWSTGTCLVGLAALHPSMRRLDERSLTGAPSAGPGRLGALGAASLMAPAVLAIQYARGVDPQIPVVVGTCVVSFLLVMVRMASLVRAQRRVAITDALTGLHTRGYFEEAIRTETARASRAGGRLALLILDIDRFKQVNDSYGHAGGDKVLREAAARLRSCVRGGDVVARYGGEEFAVVLPETAEADAVRIGERIRTTLASTPIAVNDTTWISVSVSVGVAVMPTHGRTPEELALTADRALYAAKEAGRNRLVVGSTEGAGSDGGADDIVLAEASRLTLTDFLIALAGEIDSRIAPYEHGTAVGRWASAVAGALGLDRETQERCVLAGTLHDIGKITVPEAVLSKPGRLSDAEWRLMRTHPDQGARLLRLDPGLADVARIVRQHHERYDGSGYPDGRTVEDTAIEARILGVCDAWAAMRVNRPYQPAKPVEEAISELRRCAGTQFDPDVVEAFLAVQARGGIDEIAGTSAVAEVFDAG
jgi:two-component system cell cycle response regulator